MGKTRASSGGGQAGLSALGAGGESSGLNLSSQEAEFIRRFEELEVPPAEFTHDAHVRLGWSYLQANELPESIIRFRDALKRFALSIGKASKYHETVTLIFMLLIHERLRTGEAWTEFRARNPELFANGRELLLKYYRPEVLDSEAARVSFLLPEAWKR